MASPAKAPPRNVAVLIGSLRKKSYTRMVARTIESVAPSQLKLETVEIGELSFFNQDQESSPPASWVAFRHRIRQADAVLFATPEYNRSVPGVLKNAIDVGSRPYGQSVWDGKPGAVISVSPSGLSGFGANQHLRQSLVFLNVPTLQQPEAYVGHADQLFDERGKMTNEPTLEFLTNFINAFAGWIEKINPGKK